MWPPKWLKTLFQSKQAAEGSFHKTFGSLTDLALYSRSAPAQRLFDMLPQLEASSTAAFTDELMTHFNGIGFAGNTTGVFYFYFPIVSHILYFKPELSAKLLPYLAGPNVADGIVEVEEMISTFRGAMNLKLKENPYYLTKEGQQWVLGSLEDLKEEIRLAIQHELKR